MNIVPSHTSCMSTSLGSVGRMRSISLRSAAATSISFEPGSGQMPRYTPCSPLYFATIAASSAPELDARDVAQAHDAAVALGDDQVLELIDRAQIRVREQVDLHQVALGLTDRGEIVVALERSVHVARRKTARREPIGIDPHAHRERPAAFDGHALHALERRQAAAATCATASPSAPERRVASK